MSTPSGVVVHFLDGKVLKGTTQDFSPTRPSFHLLPADGGAGIQIRNQQLKAVFFVKSTAGDSHRTELRGFLSAPAESTHGKKIAVLFMDGELICGYSLSYSPRRDGFFMFPADPGSNNQRIFVVVPSAKEIQEGVAAEELVQRVLDSKAA